MKTPIASLVLLFLFFSNNSFAQHLAPLQVGNKWIYLKENNRISRYTIVADSVMVDSLLYYEVQIRNWVPPLEMTRYVRTDGEFYRLKMRAAMSRADGSDIVLSPGNTVPTCSRPYRASK